MGGRFLLVIAGIFAAYAFVIFHLYGIQLSQGTDYLARAGSQYANSGVLQANRGTIYFTDKNGNHYAAAINKEYPIIFSSPKEIDNPKQTATALSGLLNIPESQLAKTFSASTTYASLVKKADHELVSKVNSLELKGIHIGSYVGRYYPLEKVGAQLLGYVGFTDDDIQRGAYGVEKYFDEELSGIAGKIIAGKITSPEPGVDLYLTIDQNIQQEANRILARVVEEYHAKGGAFIVQEPTTGKILAMGGYPAFDPNDFGAYAISEFLNPVVQQVYEPGSVMKVITMAGGIDSGKITPETTYFDKGSLELNGRTIKNWDLISHGTVSMTTVIEQSINTGAAFAQRAMGNQNFKNYLVRFGFGDKSGIDLPGELKGDMKKLFASDAPAITFATASYGQGIATTPLQVINAFSAIANGGALMKPYVNTAESPKKIRNVIKKESARKISNMMLSAVDKAKIAAISGYTVAGKTGTAFLPDFQNGGYTDKVVNTYVGFAPINEPRFTILFKLDEPANAPLAGTTVVPAFHDLAQFILNYYNVPPDRL